MSEYIKRDDLIQKLMEEMCDFPESMKRELAEKSVADMESIEVVRCKDCKHYIKSKRYGMMCEILVHAEQGDDFYCSYGERRAE